MEKGVDVLVEKPLATTLAEADQMIGLAERYGCHRSGRSPGTL